MLFSSEGATNVTHRKSAYPKVMERRIPAHSPTKPPFRIFYFSALDRCRQLPDSRIHSRCGLTQVLVQK